MGAISAAAGGPLSSARLSEVLRMAAEIAESDINHDLLTALELLNKARFQPAGLPLLFAAELRQIARALLAEIPDDELVGAGGGEVAEVSAWLVQKARLRRRSGDGASVLAELFSRAAAAQVGQGLSEAGRDGMGETNGPRASAFADGGDRNGHRRNQ